MKDPKTEIKLSRDNYLIKNTLRFTYKNLLLFYEMVGIYSSAVQ